MRGFIFHGDQMLRHPKTNSGFSLIELLVVIAIVGLMAAVAVVSMGPVRGKARDAKRKQDLRTLSQLLYAQGCYQPVAGAGDYDIQELVPELLAKYPQYAAYASSLPRDPKTGDSQAAFYFYILDANGRCAIYANLENDNEPVNLNTSQPTPGSTGVWQGADGWNGSN